LASGDLAEVPRVGARLTLLLAWLSPSLPCLDIKALRWIARKIDTFLLYLWSMQWSRLVLHLPYFGLPQSIRGGRWRVVRTIHDLIPLVHPEWFTASVINSVSINLREASSSTAILVASNATRRDLMRLFPSLKPSLVHMAPLAASRHFLPLAYDQSSDFRFRHGLDDKATIVLTTCANYPYKNFTTLLLAFRRLLLCAKTSIPLRLIVVGTDVCFAKSLEAQVKSLGLDGNVIALGFLSDDELRLAYCTASLFVYLSLYEGFGLSVLEAMACGCPVICSNTTSLPEVAGHAALQVNPLDDRAVSVAMERLLFEPSEYHSRSKLSLEQATKFSWGLTASATIAVYRKAAMLQHL
jgi:alpha-1,3-rhamnosyl/mannosyltransferase